MTRNRFLKYIPKQDLPLTYRQIEVLQAYLNFGSYKGAANFLCITHGTVKCHIAKAKMSMGLPVGSSTSEIIITLFRLGAIL